MAKVRVLTDVARAEGMPVHTATRRQLFGLICRMADVFADLPEEIAEDFADLLHDAREMGWEQSGAIDLSGFQAVKIATSQS